MSDTRMRPVNCSDQCSWVTLSERYADVLCVAFVWLTILSIRDDQKKEKKSVSTKSGAAIADKAASAGGRCVVALRDTRPGTNRPTPCSLAYFLPLALLGAYLAWRFYLA